MGVLMQTLVRYIILTFVLIAGLFLILSINQQDWMREEVNIEYSSMKPMIDMIKNMTSGAMGGATPLAAYDQFLNTIPDDAKIQMKYHFGLKKTCYIISFDDFKNPLQVMLPEMKWCVGNDFFTKPSKYGIPDNSAGIQAGIESFKEESAALKNAFVCMVIAIVCVVFILIVVIVKPFKWAVPCMIVTVILAACACICVAAALGLIHSNFKFADDFNKAKMMLKASSGDVYGGRKRRDDNGEGYGEHYTTLPPFAAGGIAGMSKEISTSMQQGYMKMLMNMELKESIGSPLVMAGLGMGCLLLIVILTLIEFYMNKKFGALEVKYQNVALT